MKTDGQKTGQFTNTNSEDFKIIELKENDPKLPYVTVQVPIFNEFYVAERIIQRVMEFSYSLKKFEVQILDDSTDETSDIIKKEVCKWKEKGFNISYLHRTNRIDFKAGALREGLKYAKGEIIAIFDADFLPEKKFLLKTVGYFCDPKVSIVQTKWAYSNAMFSTITKFQYMVLDAHFQIEHTARAFSGRFLNFNGTAGLLRKSTILEVGNWQGDTLTEDLDISYRMQLKGYRIAYLPFLECYSELPENIISLKNQQARWTQGSIQVAKKLFIPILKSSFPFRVKLEAFMHLCAPMAYLFSSFLAVVIPLLLFIFADTQGAFFLQAGVISSVFLTVSLSTYYLYAQKELKKPWKESLKNIIPIFSMGAVFCINNTWAIIKAFFQHNADFLRTPKYNKNKKMLANSSHLKYTLKRNYVIVSIEFLVTICLNSSFFFIFAEGDWLMLPLLFILLLGFNYNFYLLLFYR